MGNEDKAVVAAAPAAAATVRTDLQLTEVVDVLHCELETTLAARHEELAKAIKTQVAALDKISGRMRKVLENEKTAFARRMTAAIRTALRGEGVVCTIELDWDSDNALELKVQAVRKDSAAIKELKAEHAVIYGRMNTNQRSLSEVQKIKNDEHGNRRRLTAALTRSQLENSAEIKALVENAKADMRAVFKLPSVVA